MTTLADKMTDALKRAVKVLKMVEVPKDTHVYVVTYHNGRENGFAIVGWHRTWVFSEDRRSDWLVLYTGKMTEFGTGNVPSDEVYANKQLFKSEETLAKELTGLIEGDTAIYQSAVEKMNAEKLEARQP